MRSRLIIIAAVILPAMALAATTVVTVTPESTKVTVQQTGITIAPETRIVSATVAPLTAVTAVVEVPGVQGIPGATTAGTGGGGAWGEIIGTLSDQTDLQSALDAKADVTALFSGSYLDLTNKPTLFSGSYTDLTNKPTIPASATEITYSNSTYTTVAAALNQLLYVAPGVPVVSGGSSNEIGATVTSVPLTWTIALGSAALTSQSIDNGIGSIATSLRAYTHGSQTITSNRTYTVSITDGTTPRTGSTTITFYQKIYWGTSALTSLTSAQILALASNQFAWTHTKSGVTYNCTGGLYPYFAYPQSWGLLTSVVVGGLAFTDFTTATVSHTNASGYTSNYYVVRFNSLQTGALITVNWD